MNSAAAAVVCALCGLLRYTRVICLVYAFAVGALYTAGETSCSEPRVCTSLYSKWTETIFCI